MSARSSSIPSGSRRPREPRLPPQRMADRQRPPLPEESGGREKLPFLLDWLGMRADTGPPRLRPEREDVPMAEHPLRILIIGAHPDDADIKAGGTAARWCALGHAVRLVSLTDGRAGHQTMHGPRLALRRRAEAEAAAAFIGATYDVLDYPDGELDDRLESRQRVIRLIRGFRPDLILTHRSTDYHPDHRFAGLLVQDASYIVTVPGVCPETPHLA